MMEPIKLIVYDKDNLKACPCCGDKAEYAVSKAEFIGGDDIFYASYVECRACHMRTDRHATRIRIDRNNGSITLITDGVAAATEAWNKRGGPMNGSD